MEPQQVKDLVARIVSEQAPAHDMELVEVAIHGSMARPTLEIRLDSLTHPDAVTLEELELANGWVSDTVQTIDPFATSYTLEVSSPGMNRLLNTEEQFKRYKGQRVAVKTATTGITGELKDVTNTGIEIACDGKSHMLKYEDIVQARLKPTF